MLTVSHVIAKGSASKPATMTAPQGTLVGETVTLGGADAIEIKGDLVVVANQFGVEIVRLPVREVP